MFNGVRFEQMTLLNLSIPQQFFHILGFLAEKAGAFGSAVRLLVAVPDAVWNKIFGEAFEDVLFIQYFHLQWHRQGGCKLHYAGVEKWKPAFDAVRHGHSIALRREDVAGHQETRFQVL